MFRGRSNRAEVRVNPLAAEISEWCQISAGALAGRKLFMNPSAKAYQGSMLSGTFDKVLFDYLDQRNWEGKVIYDLGTHIGFHTLNFALRVGPSGHVYSFEPHPMHQDRIKVNLSANQDLAERVTLMPIAAGNKTGQSKFRCTSSIEGGESSASFTEGASTPYPSSHYEHYDTLEVEVARVDDLITGGRIAPPDLLKIDVEGAESFVIEGALEAIRCYQPLMLIEVHSIVNMLHVTSLLLPMGYTFIILEEEDRRCFVAAEPAAAANPSWS